MMLALTPGPLQAQAAAQAPVLLAGTPVEIEVTEPISAATHHRGDHFALRLARPIVMNGVEVEPAGAIGEGEVVDAHRPGMAGKPGELVLAARFIDLRNGRAVLRGFKLTDTGQNRDTAAMVVAVAGGPIGVVSLLIPGGEASIPSGAHATAKVAADFPLSLAGDRPSSVQKAPSP